MSSGDFSHNVGFVWPGPPSSGDSDEISRLMPESVEWNIVGTPADEADGHSPPITRNRLHSMAENPDIEATAKRLVPLGAQAVGYACTSASYVRGVGGDEDICARISAKTGLQSTTTATASAAALHELGVSRAAVLSPHVDELNERLAAFLEGRGIEVVHMRGLNKLRGIEDIPQDETAELVARLVDRPDADGIFISCTGMRTSNILAALEDMTCKPVVSAMQATVWGTLRLAGSHALRPEAGSLLDGSSRPPPIP